MAATRDGGTAGAFQMPEIDVNDSQREASSRALLEWWQQKKVGLGVKMKEDARMEETDGGQYKASTVIKVTPSGLRKLTFFDGDLEH